MSLISFSFHQRDTPQPVFQRLKSAESSVLQFIQHWIDEGHVYEAFLVSTCHRFEIYARAEEDCAARKSFYRDLPQFCEPNESELREFAAVRKHGDVVQHLISVASGLDSLVLGEKEILGQLKNSAEAAEERGWLDAVTKKLLERAIKTGRRVRHETAISRGNVSVASLAVRRADELSNGIRGRNVMIVGAGKTGETVAKCVLRREPSKIYIANRHNDRAAQLASNVQGTAVPYAEFQEYLQRCDVVFFATSTEKPLFTQSDLAKRMANNSVVIDLGSPPNVEDDDLDHNKGMVLESIESLSKFITKNESVRAMATNEAVRIVQEETAHFLEWRRETAANEVVSSIRREMEFRREEVAERFRHLPEDEVTRLSRTLMNSMLHDLTANIRQLSKEEPTPVRALDFVEQLFGVSPAPSDSTNKSEEPLVP